MGGLRLSFEIWGEGEVPLLLLHGFTGNAGSWDHLRGAWGGRVRAVAVELPGHGRSPLPSRLGREGWEETLAALERLLEELGAPEVDVLGYSQGARVALGLAVRCPGRVRRLVLEGGTPGLKRSHQRALRRASDEALATFIEARGVPAFVERWEALPLFAGLRRLPAQAQALLRARRLAGTAAGYAGALRCLGLGVQPCYWAALPWLSAPTLVLTGGDDDKFSRIGRQMTWNMRQAWRRTFPGVGHSPHLEAPGAYAEEVLAFLSAPSQQAMYGT